MRDLYLDATIENAEPPDDAYFVGVNGGNSSRVRKIVWAGRLRRVMTFQSAYSCLGDPIYRRMRDWEYSPLHVRPLTKKGRLIGYEHRSREHEERDAWVLDLLKSERPLDVTKAGNRLLLREGISAWQGFPRDVCFLFDNLFFATGRGLEIDDYVVSILQDAQPNRRVDHYGVFGYRKDGSADGRTGSYLELGGNDTNALIDWISSRSSASLSSRSLKANTSRANAPRKC